MNDEHIAAWTDTETSNYPGYVSINRRDGKVEFTVRSPRTALGYCGGTAAVSMSEAEFASLMLRVVSQSPTLLRELQ